jgi:(1->4)-alpha-D-glucan 1-alpha-D-glucosylmutase
LFLKDLRTHAKTFAWFGMLNTLTMTVLKFTCPGVPDIYQGNETYDLSLVDPDNRRPVDYDNRSRILDELESIERAGNVAASVHDLAASALTDGRTKMWIVWRTLTLRRTHRELFDFGQYVPLQITGSRSEHVIAFVRRYAGKTAVTLCGRLWMKLGGESGTLPLGEVWGDTAVEAGPLSGEFENIYTGERLRVEGRLPLSQVFATFPAALLVQI